MALQSENLEKNKNQNKRKKPDDNVSESEEKEVVEERPRKRRRLEDSTDKEAESETQEDFDLLGPPARVTIEREISPTPEEDEWFCPVCAALFEQRQGLIDHLEVSACDDQTIIGYPPPGFDSVIGSVLPTIPMETAPVGSPEIDLEDSPEPVISLITVCAICKTQWEGSGYAIKKVFLGVVIFFAKIVLKDG